MNLTATDKRGVTYSVTKMTPSPKHADKRYSDESFTIRRISDRPVDIKRANRPGMSNSAKRAKAKL